LGRRVKFFGPGSRYTFYVTEFEGEDTLYGWWVSGLGADCDEWGYASFQGAGRACLPGAHMTQVALPPTPEETVHPDQLSLGG
jgi:hypothetical protein